VSELRPHQGRLLVIFEGIADRDVADGLRGVLLCVDSDSVPQPEDPDEFLDHQLVGLRAESVDGEVIGSVVRIEHGPGHDLLVVRLPDRRQARAVRAGHRATVDVAGGRVKDPPDGLFDV
jgi:16S rRNA processing protein RimM